MFRYLLGMIVKCVRRRMCRRFLARWHKYYANEAAKLLAIFMRGDYEEYQIDTFCAKEIRNHWSDLIGYYPDINYYRLIGSVVGRVDWHYVSDDVYMEHILPFLNPLDECRVLEDKTKYGFYFRDVRRPREIIRCVSTRRWVNDIFYDENNRVITSDEALRIAVGYKGKIVIKPASGAWGGAGIVVLDARDETVVKCCFDKMCGSFVVQAFVGQSKETERFNKSSLNTFRITTLFLNGKITIQSVILRFGLTGALVDNVYNGGVAVGVKMDGELMKFGYGADGRRYSKTSDGEAFDSIKIRGFSEVVHFVEGLHSEMPYVPLVGWDIALDDENEPVLIEMNATAPGIAYEQMCTGPIFGDRFDEVMKYVQMRINHRISSMGNWRPDWRFPDFGCLI